MEDILEESWFLQEWMQKGEAKGEAKGRLRELRDTLVHLTTLRFPDLTSQAQKLSEQTESQDQLRTMIDQVVTATTDQEARATLTSQHV